MPQSAKILLDLTLAEKITEIDILLLTLNLNIFTIWKKEVDKQEGNLYDKIVKENIESIIPALMNSVLGFKVAKAEVIREKLQQTKEKEADALRIVTDPNRQKFILHLEFRR